MNIHEIKHNYNMAWSSYYNFVQKWQRYANEPADSANNQQMSEMFAREIQPRLMVWKILAKANGVKVHDESEAL